jgi:isopenicillin-N N-acyltransferase-like protein
MTALSLPELAVGGTPYEIGFQHGWHCGREIRAFLADRLARVNALREEPLGRDEAAQAVRQHTAWIEAQLPELAEELHGLAEGAGISYLDAALLQLRRELIRHPACACDCTSIGTVDADGRVVLGQNVDLAGGMERQALILRVAPKDPAKPRVCMLTFKGLCGYLGVNSAGLAVGLTMVFSRDWRPGVPPYLLVRHLLGQRTLDGLLAEIPRIRRASSRYLLASDGKVIVGIEMTAGEERLLFGRRLVHTNHFLHPDLVGEETLGGHTLAGSRQREATARRLLDAGRSIGAILGDHDGYPRSICAHSLGTLTVTDTVGSVLLLPGENEVHALAGHPCESTHVRYRVVEEPDR